MVMSKRVEDKEKTQLTMVMKEQLEEYKSRGEQENGWSVRGKGEKNWFLVDEGGGRGNCDKSRWRKLDI